MVLESKLSFILLPAIWSNRLQSFIVICYNKAAQCLLPTQLKYLSTFHSQVLHSIAFTYSPPWTLEPPWIKTFVKEPTKRNIMTYDIKLWAIKHIKICSIDWNSCSHDNHNSSQLWALWKHVLKKSNLSFKYAMLEIWQTHERGFSDLMGLNPTLLIMLKTLSPP